MEAIHRILDLAGYPLLAVLFVFLLVMETKYGLRKRVQSKVKRMMINSGLGFFSYAMLRLLFIPAVVWLAVQNRQWHAGLNYALHLPAPVEFTIGFLLLDYSNYLWHILLHRTGILWRFHTVHHTDLDLDVMTAVRFHFGEMIASVVFRGAAVVLTGASPVLVLVYEIFFEAATNFHHSNWRLPSRTEKLLNKVLVTPRMHGIHHSIVQREANSNFSVIFSWWDRLHQTLRMDVLQDDLTIGIPAYRHAHELTLWQLLKMPFTRTREWKLPDGTVPERNKPGQL